jgi:hypothetical protein
MRFAAWLLVWLALAIGLLQVLTCAVKLFSSGWAAPAIFILMLLPFLPLILIWEIGVWRRLDPVVPATAAIISIAVSGGFYWELFRRMAE